MAEEKSWQEVEEGEGKGKMGGKIGNQNSERSGSTGKLDKMWKRNWNNLEKERIVEGDWAFHRSKKVQRSPIGDKEGGGGIVETILKEIKEEMRLGFGEMRREIEGMKMEMRTRKES